MNSDSVDELIKRLQSLQPPPPILPPAGGGGTSDDMEGRVAKLEAHMEVVRADMGAVKKDVGDIRVNVATLMERIAHLPSKGFVVTATSTTIALLAAVSIFGDRIKALFGL